MKIYQKLLNISILSFLFFYFLPSPVNAVEIKSYLVTEAFEKDVPGSIRVYFHKVISINYNSGRVVLSQNPDGTGEALVGESIQAYQPFIEYFERVNTTSDCSTNKKMPPLDITHLLRKGLNNINVSYRRECSPGIKKSDQLYLVHFDDYEPTIEPFLDLPWDYTGNGQSFEDAALSMSSYFDHEYPLLSSNYYLKEPSEVINSVISYKGFPRSTTDFYSSHDGYDYAFNSKVKLNDPVLAAAQGEASYINSCGSCGNAIHIDHGNGYQSRYYHLQPDGLITNNPNQKIMVTNRQPIGNVGLTGITDGAHIHFMVVKDKNGDGNFDDNIPDGLVDPYGWQSYDPDPWENYVYDWYGMQKTGSKSNYIWKQNISKLKKTLNSEGKTFNANRYGITFPKDFTLKDLILTLKPLGISEESTILDPIGQGIDITLWDGISTFFTEFQKKFTLKFKFSGINTSRYYPESISMYSSIDGINWEKESTTIDWEKLEATMQANHLTQFALMGEKLDSIAPETNVVLSGTEATIENQVNVFSSPVNITLIRTDAPQEQSLGIEYTLYKVNDDEWTLYEVPIEFSAFKSYKVSYYSVDKDGNTENPKTIEFSIIEEKFPEFEIYFNFDSYKFQVTPIPGHAIVTSERSEYKNKDQIKFNASLGSKSTVISTATKYNPNKYSLELLSILYGDSISQFFEEKLIVQFINDERKIKQTFIISDTMKIILFYSEDTNISKIIIESNNEEEIEFIEGFKKIFLTTNEGKIDYKIE